MKTSLPESELEGLSAEARERVLRQAQELDRQDAAMADASARVLPGPLRQAFAAEPVRVAGVEFVPVTAGHLAILERIDSPLLRAVRLMMRHAGKSPEEIAELSAQEPSVEFEAVVETVFVLTQSPPRLRGLLAQGRPAFREAAMQAVADHVGVEQAGQLSQAAATHFAAAFATRMQYESPQSTAAQQVVFTTPPTRMGSVGG